MTYDDLTLVLSLFTSISYLIKRYCWILFFFTLSALILLESFIQTFKKLSFSCFFIFSFRSSFEVKCCPRRNFFDSIIFFYITPKLLEKYFQGPIIRENSVLSNWLTRFAGNSVLQKFSQQSQNFIFMASMELVIGVIGFISEDFILKNSPFPSSWFFPENNLFRKRYEKMQRMYSATLVSQKMGGGRGSY